MKHYHSPPSLPIRADLPDREYYFLWLAALASNAIVLACFFLLTWS